MSLVLLLTLRGVEIELGGVNGKIICLGGMLILFDGVSKAEINDDYI